MHDLGVYGIDVADAAHIRRQHIQFIRVSEIVPGKHRIPQVSQNEAVGQAGTELWILYIYTDNAIPLFFQVPYEMRSYESTCAGYYCGMHTIDYNIITILTMLASRVRSACKKWLVPLCFFTGSLVLCLLLVQHIAETYFFDKLLYYKSTRYGYWIPGKHLTFADFGPRGRDMATLFPDEPGSGPGAFPPDTPEILTVVILGDSYVWGQGLKESDRFARLLEEKLNRVRPARVISLAHVGDSILANYAKYKRFTAVSGADIYIFGLVDNDLFFNEDPPYAPQETQPVLNACPPLYTPPPWDAADSRAYPYAQSVQASFQESYGNLCVLKTLARLLPAERALYIAFAGFLETYDNETYVHLQQYMTLLRESGKTVIDTAPYYRQHYGMYGKEQFYVSPGERHLSALANRMFADILFEEIRSRQLLN